MKRKQYCKNIDIYKAGHRDALSGNLNHFNHYQKKCSEYGISLNRQKYTEGYSVGLKTFCVKEKGYEFGVKGRNYQNICPKKLEEGFLTGYRKGAKKCFYNEGQKDASRGLEKAFLKSTCLKLKGNQNQKEYGKGYQAGLQAFCVYESGYQFGLKGRDYQNICPKKLEGGFLTGYRKGAKKCLYDAGQQDALRGLEKAFLKSTCLKLKGNQNQKEYGKGYQAGLQDFCVYKNGYQFGLKGRDYQNICPKKLEEGFFKGYSLGLREYKEERRHKEQLAIERERIRAEEMARQEALLLEGERIRAAERTRHKALLLEGERIRAEETTRQEALLLERERVEMEKKRLKMENIKNYGYQICFRSSDCKKGSYCRYNYKVSEKVCTSY